MPTATAEPSATPTPSSPTPQAATPVATPRSATPAPTTAAGPTSEELAIEKLAQISYWEGRFSSYLDAIGELWPDAADALGDFPALVAEAPPTLRLHALINIHHFDDGDQYLSFATAPWYADGLSPAEVALIVTLPSIARWYPHLIQPLVDDFHSQSTTVTLPLAGEVTIWALQNTPFSPSDPLFQEIATTARMAESFLQLPFPTDHIILLVTDPSEPGFETHGWFYSSHMVLPRRDGSVPSVAHETVHYYFDTGPSWLFEGAANFMEYHVVAKEDPVARRATVEAEVGRCLERIENIRHYVWRQRESNPLPGDCPYLLGEYFLLQVQDVLGSEALASALRAMFSEGKESLSPADTREEFIYRTLAEHVPDGKEGAFRAIYQEIHGGFDGFEEWREPDDHSNEPRGSTHLPIDAIVRGSLDYSFDHDYFVAFLDAEQKYEVIFEHAVSSSSVALLTESGTFLVRFEAGAQLSDRITVPPKSGELAPPREPARISLLSDRITVPPKSAWYHLAVQNFGGESAPYTLLVRELPRVEDDHGDSLTTATAMAIGEEVVGSLHDGTDSDYFRFTMQRNRSYDFQIVLGEGGAIRSWLYNQDGVTPEHWFGNNLGEPLGGSGHSLDFAPLESGDFYLMVDGARQNNLEYSVRVTAGEMVGPE